MSDGIAGEGLDELTQISQDLGLYDTDGHNPMIKETPLHDPALYNKLTQTARDVFNPEMLARMREKVRTPRSQYTGTFSDLSSKIQVPNQSQRQGEHLSSDNFCYWLQGFVELCDTNRPTELQWELIKQHLQLVFNKKTSNPVDLIEILDQISQQVKFTPGKSELIC